MIAAVTRAIAIGTVAAIVLSAQAHADWPIYRHDLNNSGNAGAEHTWHSVHLRVKWTCFADSRITSTPTIAGSLLYAGTWNGDVLALDPSTGSCGGRHI